MRILPKTPNQKRRAKIVALFFLLFVVGVAVIIYSMRSFIVYYYTPSEAMALQKNLIYDKKQRIGGVVKPGSIIKTSEGLSFVIQDNTDEITVDYNGAIPSLFKENSGTIAEGKFEPEGGFKAVLLLSKHDENYQPPIAADSN